jgi:hypothetical protein
MSGHEPTINQCSPNRDRYHRAVTRKRSCVSVFLEHWRDNGTLWRPSNSAKLAGAVQFRRCHQLLNKSSLRYLPRCWVELRCQCVTRAAPPGRVVPRDRGRDQNREKLSSRHKPQFRSSRVPHDRQTPSSRGLARIALDHRNPHLQPRNATYIRGEYGGSVTPARSARFPCGSCQRSGW